jgi:hypothetical protein
LLFDVALAKTSRRVTAVDKISSTFLAGYHRELNPVYEAARLGVLEAQSNLTSVQLGNATSASGGEAIPPIPPVSPHTLNRERRMSPSWKCGVNHMQDHDRETRYEILPRAVASFIVSLGVLMGAGCGATYTQKHGIEPTDLTLEKLRAESGAFTLPEGVVVLSEEELRAEIVGSTINGVYPTLNGIPWIEWYNPNGEIHGFVGIQNYTGKWSIVGPVLCYAYVMLGKPLGTCLTLSLDGDQINFHTNEGTLWPDVPHGTLTEGNPQGL